MFPRKSMKDVLQETELQLQSYKRKACKASRSKDFRRKATCFQSGQWAVGNGREAS